MAFKGESLTRAISEEAQLVELADIARERGLIDPEWPNNCYTEDVAAIASRLAEDLERYMDAEGFSALDEKEVAFVEFAAIRFMYKQARRIICDQLCEEIGAEAEGVVKH